MKDAVKLKLRTRKLKALSHEAMAIVDYLVTEAVAPKKQMKYRLKVPYKSLDKEDVANDGNLVIEIKVTYDGEFKEEPDEQHKTYKVSSPNKNRH